MTPEEWRALKPETKADTIRLHYRNGISMAQLAASIGRGIARNAIIGVYNRNPSLRETCPPMPPKKAVAKANVERRNKPVKRLNQAPKPALQRVYVPVVTECREPLNLRLEALSARMCKWPMNDGGPFLFCGCATAETYCGYHARMSVGNGTPGERRADKVLAKEML